MNLSQAVFAIGIVMSWTAVASGFASRAQAPEVVPAAPEIEAATIKPVKEPT
jgi:hypothetical protein